MILHSFRGYDLAMRKNVGSEEVEMKLMSLEWRQNPPRKVENKKSGDSSSDLILVTSLLCK